MCVDIVSDDDNGVWVVGSVWRQTPGGGASPQPVKVVPVGNSKTGFITYYNTYK